MEAVRSGFELSAALILLTGAEECMWLGIPTAQALEEVRLKYAYVT